MQDISDIRYTGDSCITQWGEAPTPCTVENPHIFFDFPET